ncbi:hypothetical protein BSLA_02f3685 [Burkholderia stabilis]|nr:hypothetical protein BSLA_02f3685 [Burkholderia stabilis]
MVVHVVNMTAGPATPRSDTRRPARVAMIACRTSARQARMH